jgi:hypothetical protein
VPSRRRSLTVSASLTAALALALSGCSSSNPTHRAACVDRQTGERIPDRDCERGFGHGGWYFLPIGARFPGLGARAAGGSFAPPRGDSRPYAGLDTKGGTVAKGGFGSRSYGHGVGG